MIQLATNFNLPPGSRLDVGRPYFDEELERMAVTIRLLTAPGTNAPVASVSLVVTNTDSDKIARQTAPAVGLGIERPERYFIVTQRPTPTGYTDAVNAWRTGGATPAQRRNAFEAHLYAAGHLEASLAAAP